MIFCDDQHSFLSVLVLTLFMVAPECEIGRSYVTPACSLESPLGTHVQQAVKDAFPDIQHKFYLSPCFPFHATPLSLLNTQCKGRIWDSKMCFKHTLHLLVWWPVTHP